MTTGELMLRAWERDPFVLAMCLTGTLIYAVAFRSGRVRHTRYFAAAIVIFVLALASPIGVLSRGYSFSAHMLQHLLLVLVIPPLALLSLREQSSAQSRPKWPLFWLSGVGAMWLWH